MYTGLLHLHSFLRYVILLLILIALFRSFSGWLGKKPFTSFDNKASLFSMIFLHLQFVLGLVLYFSSPKVQFVAGVMKEPQLRFFTVEHSIMMFLGVMFVTFGKSFSKKQETDIGKHKKIAIFFLIGLLLIFFGIPWPFLKDFGTWF
ncbi:MAG: cytochrome B [Flavobacteriales bacterium]|nr:MAG: cytochrome B [Flavobacteriales bacterium]